MPNISRLTTRTSILNIEGHLNYLGERTSPCPVYEASLNKKEMTSFREFTKAKISMERIDEEFTSLCHSSLSDLLKEEICKETLSSLYIMSMYTLNTYKSTAGPRYTTFEKLHEYLNEIIPVDAKTREECAAKAEIIKPPHFVLDVKIIKASGLRCKRQLRPNKLFCKMWIGTEQKDTEFTNSTDLSTGPTWNENHRFDLEIQNGAVLNIEVRREYTAELCIKPESESHSKGPTNNDNLDGHTIGKCEIKLANVYCEGIDTWVAIKSPKFGLIKGYLHLIARMGVSKRCGGINALKRHILLIRRCIEQYSMRPVHGERMITEWEQILSPVGCTLVFLHGVIESIPICEDLICWLAAVIYANLVKSLSFRFIYDMVQISENNIQKVVTQEDDVDPSIQKLYKKVVTYLKKNCVKFIENIHSYDLSVNKNDRRDFEFSIKILQLLNNYNSGNNHDPQIILKSEAQKWFGKVDREIQTLLHERAKYLIKLLDRLQSFHSISDRIVAKVYPERTYTGIVYEELDNFIETSLKISIQEIASTPDIDGEVEENLNIFRVFEGLKKILIYTNKIMKDFKLEEKLVTLCDWFGVEIVKSWFNIKTSIVLRQIKMSLYFDDLLKVNKIMLGRRGNKLSSSVTVVSEIIQKHLTDVYMQVAVSRPSKYDSFFTHSFFDCCVLYSSELVRQNLTSNSADVLQKQGLKSSNTKEWKKIICIVANDLNAFSCFAEKTIFNTIRMKPPNSQNATAYISKLIVEICATMCRLEVANIDKHIRKVTEVKFLLQQELAVRKFILCLKRIICKEAHRYMVFDVFQKFLEELWGCITSTVQSYLERQDANDSNAELRMSNTKFKYVYQGLSELLKETEIIFLSFQSANHSSYMLQDNFQKLKGKLYDAVHNN